MRKAFDTLKGKGNLTKVQGLSFHFFLELNEQEIKKV